MLFCYVSSILNLIQLRKLNSENKNSKSYLLLFLGVVKQLSPDVDVTIEDNSEVAVEEAADAGKF